MTTDDWPDGTPRCTAKSSRTGQRCRQRPMAGGTVCRTHGGSAPQVRAAAERRLLARAVTAEAGALLAHEGLVQVDDPVLAIAHIAREAIALKDALGARVNALGERIRSTDDKGGEQLRSEVSLYERALDRTVKFLEVLARLGFEERVTRLREAELVLLAAGLRWFMVEQGLAGDPAAEERLTVMLERLDRGELT